MLTNVPNACVFLYLNLCLFTLYFIHFLFRRNVSQLQNIQIASIPQDERKLPKSLRASSLPLRISKYLTPFNTNPIDNLDIKCLSVNTRGLNKSIKCRSVFRWIHNQNVHFTLLQETHSSKLSADAWSAEWGGKVFFSHGTTNSKGVMILINPNLDCKVEKCILDNSGRFIILDVALEDAHIILVNIYAPNDLNQQVKFFKLVQHHLQDFSEEIVIIGGDFNCSLSDKDKKGGNPISKKASVIKEIEHLCSCNNLIHIWRQLNPQLESFTWRNKSHKIQCRLDFFLISEKLADLVTSCKIFHAPETDHSAISLHLQAKIKQQDRGPRF